MTLFKIYISNGTINRSSVYYSTYETALDALYDFMSSKISDSTATKAIAIIFNDNGMVMKSERWTRS